MNKKFGEERKKLGNRAAAIGIIGNIILTVFNVSVGILSGSYALISEGAHTLSDILTSVIAYLGFRIASKPADKDHPFGHGRAEAIAGLVIVVFLAIIAYEIIKGAIDKLLFGGATTIPSYLAIVMAIIGIVINLVMSQYIIQLGKKARSPAIVADGMHQRVDIFSSIAILIGVFVAQFGFPMLDPLIGLFIGFMIVKTAYSVARENLDNIMGTLPSEELINEINEVSISVVNVCGAHNVRVNYLGSYATVTLHIELPPDMTLEESHKIVHLVQDKLVDEIEVIHGATVHACPCGLEYNHNQQLDE